MTLLKLLSWALAQALGSLWGQWGWGWPPQKRLSLSSPKSMSQLTLLSSQGRGAQPSSSSSPVARQGEHPPPTPAQFVPVFISLLFWKPSTQTLQTKAGFKQK